MPTTAPASSPSRIWSPRYWPTRHRQAIMWCLAHLPYRMQMRLGRLLGRALNAIGGRRRHIAAVNLRLCLPELDERERDALLRRHLEAVGIAFIETAMSWFTPTERLRPLVELRGAHRRTRRFISRLAFPARVSVNTARATSYLPK